MGFLKRVISELNAQPADTPVQCIRTEMRKGSPEGYNAENGCSEPARKPQTGEPYERQPLYRIRCTQEKYQLLREDRRRDHRGRKHAASDAPVRYGSGQRSGGIGGTARWKQRFSGWIYDS